MPVQRHENNIYKTDGMNVKQNSVHWIKQQD